MTNSGLFKIKPEFAAFDVAIVWFYTVYLRWSFDLNLAYIFIIKGSFGLYQSWWFFFKVWRWTKQWINSFWSLCVSLNWGGRCTMTRCWLTLSSLTTCVSLCVWECPACSGPQLCTGNAAAIWTTSKGLKSVAHGILKPVLWRLVVFGKDLMKLSGNGEPETPTGFQKLVSHVTAVLYGYTHFWNFNSHLVV